MVIEPRLYPHWTLERFPFEAAKQPEDHRLFMWTRGRALAEPKWKVVKSSKPSSSIKEGSQVFQTLSASIIVFVWVAHEKRGWRTTY